MTATQRKAVSGALAFALLIAVLAILSLGDFFTPKPPEPLLVREVQIYTPPPPPPPPPLNRADPSRPSSPNLNTADIAAPIELSTMALSVNLRAGEPGTGVGNFTGEIGVDWGNVELSQLDDYPVPLQSPVYTFPREAVRQGITEIEVKLHIVIDEEGNAYLIDVLSASYPEKTRVLEEYVSQVKFTAPTLLGVPVRTEFAWPVVFTLE